MGSPNTETPIEIKFITDEDRPAVLNFLKQFFFRDEPLNESMNLVGDDGVCLALEQFAMRSTVHAVSIMATDPSGKILGIALNNVKERGAQLEEETDLLVHDEKFEKITTLLEYVDRECDVFGQYPDIDKQLLIDIISVDSACRGQGIAQKLMERTR